MTSQKQFFSSLLCHADIPLHQITIEESPTKSLEETNRITLIETIQKSDVELVFTHQKANNRDMRVIFIFSMISLYCHCMNITLISLLLAF